MEDDQHTQSAAPEAQPAAASERRAMIACWVIIAAFFATAIAVQFIVRLDWGPDEPDHLEYIHELSRGRIPTVSETHQVQHGPVYYLVMAGLWRAVGVQQDPATVPRGITGLRAMTDTAKLGRRVLRGTCALLGCAVLVVLLAIMDTLETPWSARPWLLLIAAGDPVLQYLGGIVNNEIASIFYSSIICLLLIRTLKAKRCSVRHAAVLGLLVGGTLLIKRTGLFVAPVALWVVWSAGERDDRWRRLGAFALGAVATGMWWPLYTWHVTGGLFGSATPAENQPNFYILARKPDYVLSWIIALLETSLLPTWYWEIILRRPVQIVGATLLAITIAVAIWGAVSRRDRFHFRVRTMAVVAMVSLFMGVMQYILMVDWRANMHGRYLLNAVPWLICLFAGMRPVIDALSERLGEASWWKHVTEMAGPLFALAVVVFDGAWWYLAWVFYSNIEKRF